MVVNTLSEQCYAYMHNEHQHTQSTLSEHRSSIKSLSRVAETSNVLFAVI